MPSRSFAWKPTVAVLLFVGFSLLAYRLWLIPLSEEVVLLDLEARQEIWERRLEEEERRRSLQREALAERREAARREAWIETVLPPRLDPEAALETIRGWAGEAELEILEGTAGPVEPFPPLVRSRLRLRLAGRYAAHSRFLGRIASDLPLATVDELQLEAEEAGSADAAEDRADALLVLDLTLSLYADGPGDP